MGENGLSALFCRFLLGGSSAAAPQMNRHRNRFKKKLLNRVDPKKPPLERHRKGAFEWMLLYYSLFLSRRRRHTLTCEHVAHGGLGALGQDFLTIGIAHGVEVGQTAPTVCVSAGENDSKNVIEAIVGNIRIIPRKR